MAVLFSPALSPVRLILSRPLQLVVVSRALSGPARSFLSFGGRCLGSPLLSYVLSGPARSFPSCGSGGLGGTLLSCALSGPARSRSSTLVSSPIPLSLVRLSVSPLLAVIVLAVPLFVSSDRLSLSRQSSIVPVFIFFYGWSGLGDWWVTLTLPSCIPVFLFSPIGLVGGVI